MSRNNIKVINSDSFRGLSTLEVLYFDENQIDTIDENLIDTTRIYQIDGRSNICVNQSIADHTVSKVQIRTLLRKCFQNFDELLTSEEICFFLKLLFFL